MCSFSFYNDSLVLNVKNKTKTGAKWIPSMRVIIMHVGNQGEAVDVSRDLSMLMLRYLKADSVISCQRLDTHTHARIIVEVMGWLSGGDVIGYHGIFSFCSPAFHLHRKRTSVSVRARPPCSSSSCCLFCFFKRRPKTYSNTSWSVWLKLANDQP